MKITTYTRYFFQFITYVYNIQFSDEMKTTGELN